MCLTSYRGTWDVSGRSEGSRVDHLSMTLWLSSPSATSTISSLTSKFCIRERPVGSSCSGLSCIVTCHQPIERRGGKDDKGLFCTKASGDRESPVLLQYMLMGTTKRWAYFLCERDRHLNEFYLNRFRFTPMVPRQKDPGASSLSRRE